MVLVDMSTRTALVPMPAALGVAAKRSRRLTSTPSTPALRREVPASSVARTMRRVRSAPQVVPTHDAAGRCRESLGHERGRATGGGAAGDAGAHVERDARAILACA